jgi:SAM-dependent methyltransferase
MKRHEDNPKSIKYHVKKYLYRHQECFKNRMTVDLPAGNGITSRILKDIGGTPHAFDLFPEYFLQKDIECRRANVLEGVPLENKFADHIICQEGIEHFSDQFHALKEFNRILKLGGTLIITTPNYSNLRSRLSYFLSESERYFSLMPPNEIDSVWMNQQEISSEVYFGHVFLIGVQKLRVLAKLSGFEIKEIQFNRVTFSSFVLFLFSYPFILAANFVVYLKNVRKDKGCDRSFQKKVYREILALSISPKILLDSHLFVVLQKAMDSDQVMGGVKSAHREFGST